MNAIKINDFILSQTNVTCQNKIYTAIYFDDLFFKSYELKSKCQDR